jgi:hypothetical protein
MKRLVNPLSSRLIIAPVLLQTVPRSELLEGFARHDTGDWGYVSDEVRTCNVQALSHGGVLISRHKARNGQMYEITTTADSKITCFDTV